MSLTAISSESHARMSESRREGAPNFSIETLTSCLESRNVFGRNESSSSLNHEHFMSRK